MIKKTAQMIVDYSWFIIIISVILLATAGWQLSGIYFEDSTDMWFLEDDEMALTYKSYKRTFQNDEFLSIAIGKRATDQDVFHPDTITLIREMTEFLDEHVHVTKVRSLSKYQYMKTENDILKIDNVIPEDEQEFAELNGPDWQNIRNIMQNESLSVDMIISSDFNSTIISARIIESDENRNARLELAQEFNDYLQQSKWLNQGWDIHLLGAATINENYFRYSDQDSRIIYPVMLLIIVVLLALLFKTVAGVILPILLVIFSVVMTLGVAASLGWPLNMLNIVLPLLVMVIGLADSIHIMVSFYDYRRANHDNKTAAKKTVEKLFLPCLYTTITTFIGFIALASSQLVPVIEFGIEAAIGVLIAYVLSIIVLPAALSHINGLHRPKQNGLSFIEKFPGFSYRHRYKLALLTVLLIPISIGFIGQISIDTSFERNFKPHSAIRKSINFYEQHYGGALGIEMVLDSGQQGGAKESAFLIQTWHLQKWLENHECCGRSITINDYLMEINQKLNDNDQQFRVIPDNRALVSQFLLLYSNGGPEEDLTDMLSNDESKIRLSAILKSKPAEQTTQWFNEIKQKLNKDFPELNATLTGRTIMFNNMDSYIQNSLITSFSLAFLVIVLCFFVLFRSFKYGLLAMLPSVFPIIVVGGVMGVFDIYLDFATMMVAAVTIGIAVDDTIHFLWHYINHRRNGNSREESINHAVINAGKAIVFTSIILACGFFMLLFSAFIPTIYFGVLGGIVVIFALLVDLVFLPALMYLGQNKKI